MMKTIIKSVVLLLLLAQSMPLFADEVLWKSGLNLYVKLVDQDRSEPGTPPNEQPVSLDAKQITNALKLIEIWDRHLFKKDEVYTAFSTAQAALLGQYLSAGLSKARPDQDIIFSVIRREKKYVVVEDRSYTAGRAFYANGRLNIIIGDFARLPDRFRERAYKSSGIEEIPYAFNHGKRSSASDFDKLIITKPGIQNYQQGSKTRKDWLVIDVPTASNTYIAEHSPNQAPDAGAASAAVQQEAAKLAQERREMRLEMARLRKEMAEGGVTGKHTNGPSVEERLKQLKELKSQGLITDKEYQAKRKEILDDL